jgi:hypothetical protein
MKITKRQLRRLIREMMEPMTVDYTHRSLKDPYTFGRFKGMTKSDAALDAISSRDFMGAANRVMDALMIDDPPPGADEELADLLMSAKTGEDIAQIAADWGTRHFRTIGR